MPEVRGRAGCQVNEAIHRIRSEIAERTKQLNALETAPQSRADMAQRAEDYAARAHAQASAELREELRRRSVQSLPLDGITQVEAGAGSRKVDLGPMLAALLGPKQFAKALVSLLGDVPEGLDAEERAKRIADLEAGILTLCREEEREIRALEALGLETIRRADAPPAVVLAFTEDLQ
jgi:hypothetical protein